MQIRVLNGILVYLHNIKFQKLDFYCFVVHHRSMLFYTVDIRFRFETNSPPHRLSHTNKKDPNRIYIDYKLFVISQQCFKTRIKG